MTDKDPSVKILTGAQSRKINTKSGEKTVWYQGVQVECDQFRVNVDMDLDNAEAAHQVGKVFEWDARADLVPGAFASIDLARRMTLRPVASSK